ncbi:DUF4232 domain-containing protein [Actinoplanes sp. KI2]|uniref:DUF4232 domain-containing protein n=1 Tax=Actinoplanes sp. KI2 TaxID=2983315 RepID=UPI0021D5D992|nr:DUF4232 domain-containing protein [Actinoplanes sp. KI2]MCU7727426.1 DUF4232 domain-containing protein [Actinoplanes sp. KI2]
MRPAVLAVPAIAAAVLLSSAACAADRPAATPATGSAIAPISVAPSGHAAGTGISTPGNSTSGTSTPGSGSRGTTVAACRTGDVGAVVTLQPERNSGTTRMALVTLTNKTKSTCVVDGWASISLVNAADEVVPVRTTRVDQPGAPVRTVLRPGTTAFAGIKWTACDKADASCGVGNTLRFNLQASTDGDVAELEGFPNPAANAITMTKLQLGSLQPSRQGVVAW